LCYWISKFLLLRCVGCHAFFFIFCLFCHGCRESGSPSFETCLGLLEGARVRYFERKPLCLFL
jgi:hypothetical protein